MASGKGKATIEFSSSGQRKLTADLQKELNRRLNICGVVLQNAVMENISIPTASAGPSLPGESPHADTGALKKSIFQYVKNLVLYVGSKLNYAWFLEVGTRNMAPRPYLRKTLNEVRPILKRILERGRP